MFRILGQLAYRLRWIYVLVGLLTLAVGITYGSKVFSSLKSGGIQDPRTPSAEESALRATDFPRSRTSLILLAGSSSLTVDQPEFRQTLTDLLFNIAADPSKPSITSYYSSGSSGLVSRDRKKTFALIGVSGDQDAAYERVLKLIKPGPLKIELGGPAASDYEINAEVQKDLPKLGAISLPMLGILLFIIFRSPIAALLPLLIGAVSVLGAFALTRVLTSFMDVSVFAANIISLLGLGLAIDYSLLYVSRFRDEIALGKSVETAVLVSTSTAGESIFLSGTTVALSLLGLLAFPEMFLRSMGAGGALAVIVAMVSSLTVLPALLSVIGVNIDWLSLPDSRSDRSDAQSSRWRAFGLFVVRWPLPVLVVSLGLLLAAGEPFLHVRFANPGVGSLPKGFSARVVAETITRDFPKAQNPPIELLVTLPGSPTATGQLNSLQSYVNRLSALAGVQSVGSVLDVVKSPAASELKQLYVSGNTTLLTVSYVGDVSSSSVQRLVRAVRNVGGPPGATVLVGGDTAELVDRLDSLYSHLPTAIAIIFVSTFIVLFLMLSSIVVPIKAIVLNTLSLSSAFGLMTWIFQYGHLHKLLQFTPSDSLDPTLPVLIFAIAFGLATDYEVFLVTRIKEEFDRTGNNTEAVVIGVEKTGGIITSAGLLLVVVVAAFGLSDILSMKEMGVGLAIAVAVDAAIVRTFLVPAAMQLFDRLNWWMPGKEVSVKTI